MKIKNKLKWWFVTAICLSLLANDVYYNNSIFIIMTWMIFSTISIVILISEY